LEGIAIASSQSLMALSSSESCHVFQVVPVDIILLVFAYLEPHSILSLRQLNKGWATLIDGEDVSKYLLHHPSLTFKGDRFATCHGRALGLEAGERRYAREMEQLSARLRRVHRDGPIFSFSIPHPADALFCYGCGTLCLQTDSGKRIEVRDFHSKKVLTSMAIASLASSPGPCSTDLVGMRIRDSVLSLDINEAPSHQAERSNQHNGSTVLLFFSLGSAGATLLLKIPRRMRDSMLLNPETRGLYDHNSRFAVICTCQDGWHFSIDVWNLVTGQLSMGAIQWRADITAVAIAPNDAWSIVSRSRKWIKSLDSPISYTLTNFDSSGRTIHQTSFTLKPFPRVEGSKYMRRFISVISLQFGPGSDAFSVLWRESTRSDSKLQIITFDTATGECLCCRLVLSESSPHLGNRVFVNIPAEYVFVSHISTAFGSSVTSYLSLRQRGGATNFTTERSTDILKVDTQLETTTITPGDDIREHWITCIEACACPHKGFPSVFPVEMRCPSSDSYGDEEFVCFRRGVGVDVFRFGSGGEDNLSTTSVLQGS
jgi:F-box domain